MSPQNETFGSRWGMLVATLGGETLTTSGLSTDGPLLAGDNFVSFSPVTGVGSLTLSLDVTEDCNTLFVHAMFADDPDKIAADITNGMERWVREALE